MPGSVVNTQVTLLPVAPTAADSPATFPLIAHNFFGSIWTAVLQINVRTGAYTSPPTPLTQLPHPPADSDAAFVTLADANLAAMPLLITQANGMIDALLLPCSHITALPTAPSRGGNPTGFASAGATFLAALPTFRTEFNAFINALNAYDPVSAGLTRYHKFTFTSSNGTVGVYTIKGFASVGGSDMFSGKTVTTTSASVPASNAVDGSDSTYWQGAGNPSITIDVGSTSPTALISILPRNFAGPDAVTNILYEFSPDNATWTTVFNTAVQVTPDKTERQLTPAVADSTGYRYYWFKQTGNNFAGSGTSYLVEWRLIGQHGENLALQNVAWTGSVSDTYHAYAVGIGDTTSAAVLNLNDTLGVDLGKRRAVPVSVQLRFADSNLFASNGPKQWELYGSNTNSIGTATLIKSVTDTSGTPVANEVRTYTIP